MTQWVEEFIAWARNNGGIARLSLACDNRELPSDGRTYEFYTRVLQEWHEEFRLSEVFDDTAEGYEPPESPDRERFEEVLSEYHADGENAPKVDEYTDREEAEYYLIQAQTATIKQALLDMDAEKGEEDSSDSSEDKEQKNKKQAKEKQKRR